MSPLRQPACGNPDLTISGKALAFGRLCGQIARHENRRNLHYLLHYYPLAFARGAVFFTPTHFEPKNPRRERDDG